MNMNWREKLIIRILLLITKIVASDHELRTELRNLSNHIEVHAK